MGASREVRRTNSAKYFALALPPPNLYMEKIYKKGKNIIIEIPFYSKRSNPYMPDDADVGEYPTLIGLLYHDKFGNDEIGFAQTIDMDYKGKDDQWTDIKYQYWGEAEEFIRLCKKLKIGYVDERLTDVNQLN